MRRGRRKSRSVPSTAAVPAGRPRSSERSTLCPGTRRASESTTGGPEGQIRMRAASVRARIGADVLGRHPNGEAGLGERVLDAQFERERIALLRMQPVAHHGSFRLARGDAPRRPADEAVDRVVAVRLRQWELVRPAVELVAPILADGWATGSAAAHGPRRVARPRDTRRGARGRPPSTSAAPRRPRRPRPAGRRTRSRSARRRGRSPRLRRHEREAKPERAAGGARADHGDVLGGHPQ